MAKRLWLLNKQLAVSGALGKERIVQIVRKHVRENRETDYREGGMEGGGQYIEGKGVLASTEHEANMHQLVFDYKFLHKGLERERGI
jgi:hypothetical protein